MTSPKQQLTSELEVVKHETAPILSRVSVLDVETPQQYALADSLLSKIVTARKGIKERLSKILNPLKDALKEMQGLQSEVDSPLAEAEDTVRGKMKAFKMEELRQEQERKRIADAEADRIRKEARAKEEAAAKAKTASMKSKLQAQAAELENEAEIAQAAPAPAAVQVAHSTTRTTKTPMLQDLGTVLQAILDGHIPEDVVMLNMVAVRAYYKSNPNYVTKWPGFTIIDQVQIVHQGR